MIWVSVNKTIFTKRYGVDLVKYTHHPDCILFSSLNDSNDCKLSVLSHSNSRDKQQEV